MIEKYLIYMKVHFYKSIEELTIRSVFNVLLGKPYTISLLSDSS